SQPWDAHLAWHRIELLRLRFPFPHTARHSHPKIALAVLVKTGADVDKGGILSGAPNAAIMNVAELAKPEPADPYRAFVILENSGNPLSGKLGVLNQFTVLQTSESFGGANPKRPIACCD